MPKPPTGSTWDVFPSGESLGRALQWISDRRREGSQVPLYKLIDEAAVRFDLSPPDTQFLLENLSRVPDQPKPDA